MKLFRKILLLAGFAFVLFRLFSPPEGIPILAYHRVNSDGEMYSISPGDFEAQLRYLKEKGYATVSLAEMQEAFAGKRSLPVKPIVITFDDGYADNYLQALPLLEKYGFTATVFVLAGHVGQPEYLSWEQIRAMQERRTEIGSHTFSHADLNRLTPDEQRRELAESKRLLEEKLGTPVEYLAYPYGQFSPALFALLEETGYRGACTGLSGFNGMGTPPYALKRINIPQPRYGLYEFRARLLRAQVPYQR